MPEYQNDILVALDAFIRRYYKNQLIRGGLLSVAMVGVLYLAAVLLEHFGWLSPLGRGLIFWLGMVAVVAVIVGLVARPLLKMYGLSRRRLGREEAARIVGRHFPEVGDRMVNLLQLMSTAERGEESSLLLAAIEQKSRDMRPVPILAAIDLRGNWKLLRYALPPIAIIAILLLAAPQMVTEPTKRIANYNTIYHRPEPFAFHILSTPLEALQGQDFELVVVAEGEAEPSEVWIAAEGRRMRMQKGADGNFSYTLQRLQRTLSFVLEGGGVRSEEYSLRVEPNPAVASFSMRLDYPAYTGREAETMVDLGDVAVPEGTRVVWHFQMRDADSIYFVADSVGCTLEADGSGRAQIALRAMHNTDYAFCAGRGNHRSDTLRYALTVIPDAAPLIVAEETADTLHPDRRLFAGRIKDDYGFSSLVFVCTIGNESSPSRSKADTVALALGQGAAQDFYFSFNTAELSLAPGDEVTYWFEVADNDAIHGPKTTRSSKGMIRIPTVGEMDSLIERTSEEVRQSAAQQASELQRLQQEIDEMMRRLVDKKELDWQDRRDLQQLQQKQQQVRQMMQQMQQQIEENNRMEQRFRQQSEELMEKQRELDRLMNEVMDEKMRETMAEIERMMQELDKKKVQQELEQLKMDNADLERQLDQNLELMRRLELEKRTEQAVQKADKLAEEQRKLAEETAVAGGDESNRLEQRQQQINNEYKQLEKEIEQLRQDYKDLDPSADFKTPTDLMNQIEQQQNAAQQNLQQGKTKPASGQQKQAAEALEELAEKLAEAQLDVEQDGLAEDADEIRQLLKNLVRLSFDQEELIAELGKIYIQDPRYQTIISRQNRLKEDFAGVEDSLRSLAKRQLQVAAMVTREVGSVSSGISRSLSDLLTMNQSFYGSSRNTTAARSMQYSMTSLNNLALVLAESLDNMQNQMRQNSQRKQNSQCKNKGKNPQQCNNPGGRPSPKSMRQMQEELNKQMEALKKQLDKQGNKPGEQKHHIGQQQSMSEELARMAAQQEMIRRMMQQYGQEMKEQSGGDAKLAREIDQLMRQMEQTETDLVNRTITNQTIARQRQIMTRLLEHERAEMQREREERRESHEGSELYSQPSPAELERYNNQLKPQTEQLRTVPPSLQPYYRRKVSDFFFGQD